MKIRALRLAEVGRFAEPVALEGLSGGLDVLAGPNEAGKSTLLKALRLALFQKHSSKHRDIEALRPYRGGTPTIEVEIEAMGKRFLVRKRFLTQATAELRNLGDNTLLRGADAEEALAGILAGADDDGRFGLLWAGQRAALQPVAPDAALGGPLQTALSREIDAIAGGERVPQIRAAVQARLSELVTAKRGQPTGVYAVAIKHAADRAGARDIAEAAGRHAAAQLDELSRLRARESTLTAADSAAARKTAIETARAALKAADAAIQQRDLAAARLTTAETEQAETHARQKRAMEDLARLATLDQEAARLGDDGASNRVRLDALERDATAARARFEQDRTALGDLEQERDGARAVAEQLAARGRFAELAGRETRALAAAERHQQLDAEIAALNTTPELLRAAQSLMASARENEARLTAAAPSIRVDYAPGAKGRIRAEGRTLADGETMVAQAPLVLEIAGIGRITVSPGGGDAIEDTRADLDAQRAALASLLAGAGVAEIADLEARVRLRRDLEANLAEAAAEARALAPEGFAALAAGRAAAAQAVRAPDTAAGRPRETIEADIGHGRVALADAEQESVRLERALATAREARAGLEAAAEAAHRQIVTLAAALPAEAERAAHAERLAAAVLAVTTRLNAAVRDVAAWTEAAPDPDRFARLLAGLQSAEVATREADDAIRSIALDAARIEGELAVARSEDVLTRAVMLADEAAAARAAADAQADEAAALALLDGELAAEEARGRDRYLAPVLQRLAPMLARVLPDAAPVLGDNLGIGGLVRMGATEDLQQLSDGTQEQLAVLARLAFARLFADTGAAAPVILDDALVWADDRRIAAMFDVLADAAHHHQVIVLTCREASFAGLEGNRLTLAPWRLGGT